MTEQLDTSAAGIAWVEIPDDEPRQIVCTGEAGSDVWQPSFGTWEADDFGMDSEETVGDGERLFVNRRLYDALSAQLTAETARADAAEVECDKAITRWAASQDKQIAALDISEKLSVENRVLRDRVAGLDNLLPFIKSAHLANRTQMRNLLDQVLAVIEGKQL